MVGVKITQELKHTAGHTLREPHRKSPDNLARYLLKSRLTYIYHLKSPPKFSHSRVPEAHFPISCSRRSGSKWELIDQDAKICAKMTSRD